MGKKSDAKQGKKSRIVEQDESRCPSEITDAKMRKDVNDSSDCERRKKKKRKHESGGIYDDFASTANSLVNVKGGDGDAESKREGRKKKKVEQDIDRENEFEKPVKKDKKRRLVEGSNAVHLTGKESKDGVRGKKYEETSAHGDDYDMGSKSKGVKGKKRKKEHKHNPADDRRTVLGEGQGIIEVCQKQGNSKQGEGEGTTNRLDLGYGDESKEEKMNKQQKKEKNNKQKEEEKEDKEVEEKKKIKQKKQEEDKEEKMNKQQKKEKKNKQKEEEKEDNEVEEKKKIKQKKKEEDKEEKMNKLQKKEKKNKQKEEAEYKEVDEKKMKAEMDTEASCYEVFLSFRGPDTRQGFTDVLYDCMHGVGIQVFKDDDELAVGDEIETILQAIDNSQVCVPVFSETFASSRWCLREVRRMVKLKKNVVPVFYKVTPDDVKLKTLAYRKFLEEHEAKCGKSKVEKWENALKEITKFKGREVRDTCYTEFCKKFVDEILSKLKPRKRYDIDHFVGMTDQVRSVMDLLDVGSGGVRYIGIHGMGGIGKTTLAKAIFNKIFTYFDHRAFLEDIRESSWRHGIDYVLEQLQDSLDPKRRIGSNSSKFNIRERFRRKKVLIILDDIDKWEQIEKLVGKCSWFGSGSRIIVTTRNIDVLNQQGKIDEDLVRTMEMRTLDDGEAMQLFNIHAFGKDSPPAAFMNLSEEAIATSGGLPLALVVIGSLLRNRDEKVWKDWIARSKRIPPGKVKERLQISYDALEYEQKQIFLDIACFFSGSKNSYASYMWEACELYPNYGLAVLSSMSLVKIREDGEIRMHDQLRDLGRDIVREESITDPTGRSRLWVHEEALSVLKSKEGKKVVEALSLHKAVGITLTHEHFSSFQNLRFLELAGAQVEGDFTNLLGKLTWFSWHLCPPHFNMTNFNSQNLVILDLSHSFIDENWGGWSQIQVANNLKVLDLRNCQSLTTTPNFSWNNKLERLILSGCGKLEWIDSSIGKLRGLKDLDISYCYSLCGLPEEIGLLEHLEKILASGSYGTFDLPNSIGNLRSLTTLKLEDFCITDITDSVGGLFKLTHCLDKLPESVGNLESLVELDLSGSTISELPNSIGGLMKLETLSLDGCSEIEELPESIGKLESLVQLNLAFTSVVSLPDSIGDLQELMMLDLFNCNIKKLPASIGRMRNLEKIDAYNCRSLAEIPEEIGELSSLEILNLTNSPISTLPSTIIQLTNLWSLELRGNDVLQELPDLPSSLTTLRVSSGSLRRVPNLSNLNNLIHLMLPGIHCVGIENLTRLEHLELVLSNATTLPFNLGSLTQLRSLELYFQDIATSAESLSFAPSEFPSRADREMSLPELSNLKNLSSIGFHNLLMKDGLARLGVRERGTLEDARIFNCSFQVIEICLAKSLESLFIQDCESMEILPDLSHLKALKKLGLWGCKDLQQIPGLERLESLETLEVESCDSLQRLGNLSKLRKLCFIRLIDCRKLKFIEGMDTVFVEELIISDCKLMENMEELRKRCRKGEFNLVRFENYC